MLRIERSANGEVVLTFSGRLDVENVAEVSTLLKSEAEGLRVVMDLKDLTLVDRDAVRFLERCEAGNVTIRNCPAYVREWIERERADVARDGVNGMRHGS